ncbi:MAG: 8-oxo-dGTP diphosphatase [Chloroflexaceae bacterium]|nr:8-oxo-dGTP diphosphatase [Chloroflexaceae bacterium]
MVYTPVVATLGYVRSPDGPLVLMLHRNTRPDDYHYGKYNGLGGKLETNEDVVSGMQRELREEAGIEALALTLRGTINWSDFGKHNEGWLAFIFRIDRWSGTPFDHNEEGTLEWVPQAHLLRLNLWPGDRYFLPMVFSDDPRQFHGRMSYEGEQPVHWSYVLL